MTQGRDILWTPSVGRYQASTMAAFERYLSKKHELAFSDYNDMWRWSISDLNSFWGAIANFFEMRFFEQPQKILNNRAMPGAEWFVGQRSTMQISFYQRQTDWRNRWLLFRILKHLGERINLE